MADVTVYTSVRFRPVKCCTCFMIFGVPAEFEERYRKTGESFSCPSGHSQVFIKPRVTVLEEQLTQAQDALAVKDRELAQTVKRRRRIRRRVANGVCPCCQRAFKPSKWTARNLRRHVQSQHPDYLKQSV